MSWEMVKLGDVCLKVSKWDMSTPDKFFFYVDISSIDREQKKIVDPQSVTVQTAPSRARQVICKNDVLVSTVRPNLNGVALVDSEFDNAIASTGYTVLRADKKQLLPKYLFYWVRTNFFVDNMIKQSTGASYPAVNDKIVKESIIPLPPLPEQQRIAALLEQVDHLRNLRQRALQRLDDLVQSTFLEMFGDPVTNPKGWKKSKMETLMSIRRGASPRPISNYIGEDINWIKIGDGTKGSSLYIDKVAVKIKKEGKEKSVYLDEGSLIFANCGVSLGFARILKVPGCIHDGWLAFSDIDEQKLNKIFLLKTLNTITQYFRDTAPDGTQPNLNTTIMKNFQLIIPPIDHQLNFSNFVLRREQIRNIYAKSLNQLDTLFNALMQQAFTGQLQWTSAEDAVAQAHEQLKLPLEV